MDRAVADDPGVTALPPPGRSAARRADTPRGVGTLAVVLVGVAIVVPVTAVVVRSLRDGGDWGLSAPARILGSPRTWRLVTLTVAQAVGSTALTLAVGLPVAWVLGTFRFPGRRLIRLVVLVPFVLPSVVLATAVASVVGPTGPVDLRGTWWAVLIAHLCFNLAVVVLVVSDAVGRLPPSLDGAARTLGAAPLASFRRVVVPAVRPAVVSAAAVVFLFCLTSFGVVVILGGGAVTTLEVEIWIRATRQFDLSGAAVLAALQVLTVVVALGLVGSASRRAGAGSVRTRRRRPRTLTERGAVALAVGAVLLVSGVPLAALVERSTRVGDRRTWSNWTELGSVLEGTGLAVSPLDALRRSLLSAGIAALIAVLVAVPAAALAARRPGGAAERVLTLPLAISATTLGLGLLLVVGRPPVDLRGSWWLVPVAQALVALPLVVRVVAPALRSVPRSSLDAAAVLGLDRGARRRRVELPAVRGALGAGAALAFVACLGEFGATVFLARSDRATVPVVIEQLASRPGPAAVGQAMALSCVLVAVCGVVLLAVDSAGDRTASDRALPRGRMGPWTSEPS